MVEIKSRTTIHSTDGHDMDEIIESVTNKFVIDELIPLHHIISINTTPIYKAIASPIYKPTDGGCLIKSVIITIIYKDINVLK